MTEFVTYRNGNYDVSINPVTGEKIRDNHRNDLVFSAEFPECADVNITDYCDRGCPFCYMGSTECGKHASANHVLEVLSGCHPYTEVALGGGSPILHPDLKMILERLRDLHILTNITVHHSHLLDRLQDGRMEELMCGKDPLIKGLGISITQFDPILAKVLMSRPWMTRVAVHAIVGIMPVKDLKRWLSAGFNVLLLGYKRVGRGSTYIDAPTEQDDTLRDFIRQCIQHGGNRGNISFDNLALDQLGVKEMMQPEDFASKFMGDDGLHGELTSASMYLDLVNDQYAMNSMGSEKFPIEPGMSVTDMFRRLKEKSN